jgi:hypothetical protein
MAVAALMAALPADGSAAPVSVQAIGVSLHSSFSVYVTGSEEVDRVTLS